MRLFGFFIALFFSVSVAGNPQDSIVENIFNEIYNQNYEVAYQLIHKNKTELDSFYFAVTNIELSYWKNVTGTFQPNYKAFEKDMDCYKTNNPTTFNEKVIHLVFLSYQLRYELKRFRIVAAIGSRQQTKKLFKELKTNKDKLPTKHQNLFLLYNALFEYFDQYLQTFLPGNQKQKRLQALKEMEDLSKSEEKLVQTLTHYFLAKTYLKYEKNPKMAKTHFEWLKNKYPDNVIFPEFLKECNDHLN